VWGLLDRLFRAAVAPVVVHEDASVRFFLCLEAELPEDAILPLCDLLTELRVKTLDRQAFWARWQALPGDAGGELDGMKPFLALYFKRRAGAVAPLRLVPEMGAHADDPAYRRLRLDLLEGIRRLRARCRPPEVSPSAPPDGSGTEPISNR
jgi:hypothetical protein